jgi:formate/nitrite transporter
LPIVGAVFFPVGFILINMIGVDLITGYFAIVTTACVYGRLSFAQLVRLFFWVWLGNLVGSVIYATFMVLGFTMAWHAPDASGLSTVVNKIAAFKTTHYEQFGSAGALTAFTKAMLCNWMVTLGVVGPMVSRTAFGKVLITWVPIFMFFAMGYEHMVVNMFIMPASMLFGALISMADFWIGNELPVTLGNFVGGFVFTGMVIASLYYARKPAEAPLGDLAAAPAR